MIAIDISNLSNPRTISRSAGMFFTDDVNNRYVWEEPDSSGYYECRGRMLGEIVTGWVRDSVYAYCYKQ